jgi:hypothetical protein
MEEIVSAFERVGLPYLTKYSSRFEALEALSNDDRESRRLFQIMESKRMMNILLLAAQFKDEARFKQFAHRFHRYVEATVDPHRGRSLAFIEELESRFSATNAQPGWDQEQT